jgi:hypothetical protein
VHQLSKTAVPEFAYAPRIWYGCLNPKVRLYNDISLRYVLARFCLIMNYVQPAEVTEYASGSTPAGWELEKKNEWALGSDAGYIATSTSPCLSTGGGQALAC